MEFETRNWLKWETRRDKKHHFLTKNKKNRKTGGKALKNINRKLQEIQKQDKILARQDFGKTRFREMLKREMRKKTRSS